MVVVPFGLTNASAVFQALIHDVLRDFLGFPLNSPDLSHDAVLLELGNQESFLRTQEVVHIHPYPHHPKPVTSVCRDS